MKRTSATCMIVPLALLFMPSLRAQDTIDTSSIRVKKAIADTMTPEQLQAYKERMARALATREAVRPPGKMTPADTCTLATNEVGALPFGSSDTTVGMTDSYDLPTDVTDPTCTAAATCTGTGPAGSLPRGAIYTGTGMGPDRAYRIRTDANCNLTLTMDPASHDLALIVYQAACSSSLADCACVSDVGVAGQTETVSLSAQAGVDYFVVVDGYSTGGTPPGPSGPFTLAITGTGCGLIGGATHTLTVATVGSGTVTSVPAGINCPGDCTESYASGTGVTLTATPAAGWRFAGWSGACSNPTGACGVTLTADASATATFVEQHTLTASVVGSGNVTSVPAGIDCPGDCTEVYDTGTGVTLTATPGPDAAFAGWSGACTNPTGDCTVTMDADASVTATFVKGLYYTIELCRLIDTRLADGPLAGPALVAGASRAFPVTGNCGVPANATAVSINLTAVSATNMGHLRVYATGEAVPAVSAINYTAGLTRANNGVFRLSAGGEIDIYASQAAGTVHVVVDVNGYFVE